MNEELTKAELVAAHSTLGKVEVALGLHARKGNDTESPLAALRETQETLERMVAIMP